MSPDTTPYPDVPSYIYGCTREIWEERGVGEKLARYYAPDCLVRAPTGLTTSMGGVAADTLATLHQFPDRQLVGEDVIWADGHDGSFLSSHRLISVMRHTGDGGFGPATGAQVKSRIIADCWVKDGVITEEWLVRDGAAFAACLGQTPRAFAAAQVEADLRRFATVRFMAASDEVVRDYAPQVQDDHAIGTLAAGLDRLWNGRAPAVVRELYFEGAELALPGNGRANGWSEIDRFVVSLLAAIPDGRWSLKSATVNRAVERPVRIALRWAFDGLHSGWGRFGEPTGALLHVMGLTHIHLTGGQIVAEWTLFDDVAVWKQILAHERR